MIIEYKNYKLREPISEDAMGLLEITNDNEIMKYYGTSGAYLKTKEEALSEINWMKQQCSIHAGRCVITEKSKNQYIGDIGFNNYDKKHNRIELGYKLSREYWGKGIISNFISLLVKYAFNDFDYNRIEALVDIRNEGSKVVLLKNDFVFEGILREYEFEHGCYVDLAMYSLLRSDLLK